MPHTFDSDGASAVSPARRIAVDLDGVLTEHPAPLAHAANARFGLHLPERAFIDSAGLAVPLDVREWVYSPDGPASRLAPATGAQEFLRTVLRSVGDGNALILTARPESAAGMTIDWLKRHDFPTINVLFADDKMTLARRQGCGYAIEDSERHARNYAAGGITCYLIDREQAMLDIREPLIHRVDAYDEIVALIERVRDRVGQRAVISASLPPVVEGIAGTRPVIVVSDAIHDVARAQFEEHAQVIDVDGTDLPALLAVLGDADALVVRSETFVSEEVLAAAPKLRVVARAGVGVDTIDLDAATRAGVLVVNTPGANAVSAGEHTIALLLALTRQITFADSTTRSGNWSRKQVRPIDLKGRTLGIVGLGRVGTIVAKRLLAFEMRVIAHDPYIPQSRFREVGVESVPLDQIWAQSDVITFHCPATPETHHLLNAETVRRMRQGALVINAARGEVVDQAALADALRDGHIGGAGVDVFPSEPCRTSPLFDLPNTVVTPHTGGSSAEALEAVGRVIGSSTLAALRGESVPNGVNLPSAALDAPELRRLTTNAAAAGKLLAVLTADVPATYGIAVRGQVPASLTELVLGTALSASLQQWLGRRVTPVNARVISQQIGLEVTSVAGDDDPELVPRFVFSASGHTSHSVMVSWDRTRAGIIEVDRFSLERPLAGHVLITHHRDQPGVIGRLGTILGRHGVNIAGMQVGRDAPLGEALMVTNVDEAIPDAALEEILGADAVEHAFVVALPSLEDDDPVQLAAIRAETLQSVPSS